MGNFYIFNVNGHYNKVPIYDYGAIQSFTHNSKPQYVFLHYYSDGSTPNKPFFSPYWNGAPYQFGQTNFNTNILLLKNITVPSHTKNRENSTSDAFIFQHNSSALQSGGGSRRIFFHYKNDQNENYNQNNKHSIVMQVVHGGNNSCTIDADASWFEVGDTLHVPLLLGNYMDHHITIQI